MLEAKRRLRFTNFPNIVAFVRKMVGRTYQPKELGLSRDKFMEQDQVYKTPVVLKVFYSLLFVGVTGIWLGLAAYMGLGAIQTVQKELLPSLLELDLIAIIGATIWTAIGLGLALLGVVAWWKGFVEILFWEFAEPINRRLAGWKQACRRRS
jgi:hypothetical protein